MSYNFQKLLAIYARFPQPSLFGIVEHVVFHSLRLGDTIALVRIAESETTPHLSIDIVQKQGTASDEQLLAKTRLMLGLETDLAAFYAYAQTQADLWRVIEPLVGLPIECAESVYQALVFVIIEQHISWAGAQRSQRVLVEWANNRLEYEGRVYYAMPSPEQLAQATLNDLTPLKITFKRMQLLIDISRQVVDGSLDLEGLLDVSPEAMYHALLKIKGIGHWTASVVLSRVRGVFPYIAHNDVALQAAVNHYFYGGKGRIPAEQLLATFAPHGDYAGLAAHFTLHRWVLDRYPITSAEYHSP